jgi:hypothetical protein
MMPYSPLKYQPTFGRNMSPPSSGPERNSSKQRAWIRQETALLAASPYFSIWSP